MILQNGNKILRRTAEKVADLKSTEIKALIERMAEAMFAEPDGVGIAAPQIGESLRIFLVAKDFLQPSRTTSHPERDGVSSSPPLLRKERGLGGEVPPPPYEGGRAGLGVKTRPRDYLVFINPVLKKCSQKKADDIEGCLSVRGIYGEVKRCEKIAIEYSDEFGKRYSRGFAGLLSRIIQHEMDHLDGILFIDKARNLKKLT